MKKVWVTWCVVFALAIACCGCGASTANNAEEEETAVSSEVLEDAEAESVTENQVSEDALEEDAAEEIEEVVLTEEEQIYQDMLERSLLNAGNNYRMKQVMEKAMRGEDVTIAYIGGSITEGYNAGTTEIYAKLSYEYFAETYGTGDNVHYVNAGLSGTPSMLGLIRSERDIFSYEPDLVFIEFAVNDGGTNYDLSSYEALLRRALSQSEDTAVILLFSVTEGGYTCQTNMSLIGFQYQVPMISVKNALDPEFNAGRMVWTDWSDDYVHPNATGQALYAAFIEYYWQCVDASETDEAMELPDLYKSMDVTGMTMMDLENLNVTSLGSFTEGTNHSAFKNGWTKTIEATENEAFTFTFTGDYLYVVFLDTTNENYGSAEVYVDGEKVATLDGCSSDGWNNPVTQVVYYQKDQGEHTVEIKMAEGDEDKRFQILCFGMDAQE